MTTAVCISFLYVFDFVLFYGHRLSKAVPEDDMLPGEELSTLLASMIPETYEFPFLFRCRSWSC
jgi:hypothetical protein